MSKIDDIIHARHIQEEALAEISTKINACRESIQNFEHLTQRLQTLPDKMSYEIMVPFGKFAFMPGKLVHTNEVLVHLGDAYFSSMSCKQSLKIVEMRQKNLQSTLTDLEKVAANINAKSQYLDEIKDTAERNEIEIKEELAGKYSHPKDRRRVSRMPDKRDNKKHEQKEPLPHKNVQADQHAALMARLDELEKMEEEEDETYRLSEDSGDVESNSSDAESSISSETDDDKLFKEKPKHVRFEETNSRNSGPTPCTIRFKHSKQTAQKSDEMTPGDVHKLIHVQRNPQSILKSKKTEAATDAAPKQHLLPENKAVSDVVTEHAPITVTEVSPSASSKPMSKFKASRIKR